MARVYCPDCDGRISLNPSTKLGQKLVCPHCDTDLEVISIDPVEVDWFYDWTWDEDEDEEEDWKEVRDRPLVVDAPGSGF